MKDKKKIVDFGKSRTTTTKLQQNSEESKNKSRTTTTKIEELIQRENKRLASNQYKYGELMEQLNERNCQICFWHRWVIIQTHEQGVISAKNYSQKYGGSRTAIWGWIKELKRLRMLIPTKFGELSVTSKYKDFLDENYDLINKICEKYEK